MAAEWLTGNEIQVSEATKDEDGVIRRFITMPADMPLVEGLRAVGGCSEAELERVAKEHPGPPPEFDLLVIQ